MKILFTGISGHIKKWMNDYLSLLSDDITIISRQNNLELPCNKLLCVDLEKSFSLSDKFNKIIYGTFKLPDFRKDRSHQFAQYHQVNLSMLNNFFDGLNTLPDHFIFISSHAINEYIYDPIKYHYALSKLECEQRVIDYCLKNSIPFTILRLPPLVSTLSDFSYEITKLKQKIAIFPFHKKIPIIFISNCKTFNSILNQIIFSDTYKNQIVNIQFSDEIYYIDKIRWIKSKISSTSYVCFIPIKRKLKLNHTHWKFQSNIIIDTFTQLNSISDN